MTTYSVFILRKDAVQ